MMPRRGWCLLWLLPLWIGCASPSMRLQEAYEKKDTEYLLQELAESPQEWIVEDAAKAIGALRLKEAAPTLLTILNDPNAGPFRRASAGLALARLEHGEAAKPMMTALERASDPEERFWLIVGLYQLCPTQSSLLELQATLQKAESDSDVLIKRIARKGLYECAKVAPRVRSASNAG